MKFMTKNLDPREQQKTITIFLVILFVFTIIIGASFVLKNYIVEDKNSRDVAAEKDDQRSEEMIIGGDKDEHGCLGPAGYSWCEAKQKCLRTWEDPCIPEDVLRQAAKTIGIDQDLEKIKNEVIVRWNTKDGELKLLGISIGYGDSLESENINNYRLQIDSWLKEKGFATDPYNAGSGTYELDISRYKYDNLVCNLAIRNIKDRERSEIEIACAEL